MKTPFSAQQFFSVFESYNTAVFPIQIVILTGGLAALILLFSGNRYRHYLLGGILALLWIWTGFIYFLNFFTVIGQAGFVFGILFLLEGIFLLHVTLRHGIKINYSNSMNDKLAVFFILFGLIIYPLIEVLKGIELARIIILGLPCPTTIFTIGLLMLNNDKSTWYLMIIPTLWSLIGITAAVNFKITQDFMMIVAAVAGYICLWNKNKAINKSGGLPFPG